MRVAALASLPIGTLTWVGAQPMLTVVVKATFRLEADGRATLSDMPLPLHEDGPPGASPLHNSCDYAPHKSAVDLLVVGSARAPKSAAQLPIRIAVPPVLDRRCIATAGSPTKRLPLSPHYLRGLDGPPTTTGPAAMPHDVRKNPDLGPNFDFGGFNVAPTKQRLAQLLPGTTILLEGLLGRGAPVNVTIPALAPFVFFVQAPAPWEPLRMVCDTVWVDTDRAVMSLTWRGVRTMPERFDGAFLVLTTSTSGPPDPAQLESHLSSARWGNIGPAQPPVLQKTRRSAGIPESMKRGGNKPFGMGTLSLDDGDAFRAAVLPFLEGRDSPPPRPVADEDDDDDDITLSEGRPASKGKRSRGATLDSLPVTGQRPEAATPFERPSAPSYPSSNPAPSAPGFPSPPPAPSTPGPQAPAVIEPAPETRIPDTVMADTTAAPTAARFDAPPAPSPSAPAQDTAVPETEPPQTEPAMPKTAAPETTMQVPTVGAQTLNVEDLAQLGVDLPFAKGEGLPPHVQAAMSAAEESTQKGHTMAFEAISPEEALPFLNKAQGPAAPAGQHPVSHTPAPATPPMQARSGSQAPAVPFPKPPPARSAPPAPAPAAHPSAPASPAVGSNPGEPAPRVSEPALPLPVYAAIKASALDGQTVSPKRLAEHGLDEAGWRAAERRMAVALAHDDGSLADELAAAVAQARREQTGPADELDVEAYVAIRAEVEEADDAKAALAALGLDDARWETMRRDWTKRALADRELARTIRSKLAEARRALRKVRG